MSWMCPEKRSSSGEEDVRSRVFDPFPRPVDGVPRFCYPSRARVRATVVTDVDWHETPEAHVLTADVPGMKKGEGAVEIRQGKILEISGVRSLDEGGLRDDTWHLRERRSGSFVRRIRVPENAKVDRVGASMANGVLTVTVPKEEVKKPEVVRVDISY